MAGTIGATMVWAVVIAIVLAIAALLALMGSDEYGDDEDYDHHDDY